MNKIIIVSFILIVFANSQSISLYQPSKVSYFDFFQTQVYSYIYQGIVNIEVSSDEQNNINFYVQLVEDYDCSWAKCFNGWVLNYTQNNQNPVIGYQDKTLVQSPIFRFNTNSEEDYEIVRSKNLEQVWVQIIELTCQKINPQLVKNSSLDSSNSNDEGSTLRSTVNSSSQTDSHIKCVQAPKGIQYDVIQSDQYCIKFVINTKICLQCIGGYYVNSNGKCTQVSPLCATYNKFTGDCTSCYWRHQLILGRCVFVGFDGCISYNLNTGQCLNCQSGYTLSNDKCTIFDVNCNSKDFKGLCNGCFNGYYLNKATGLCTQLNPLCKGTDLTTGNCLSCYSGYILSNGNCIISIKVLEDPNCLTYDSSNNCQQCAKNFYLNTSKKCQPINPLCKTYNSLNGDCLTCYPGYNLQGSQCLLLQNSNKVNSSSELNCKTSYNGVCSQCHSGYILSCDVGYNLVDGNCVAAIDYGCKVWDWDNQKCLSCIDGWLFDSLKSICYHSIQDNLINSPKYVFTQANIGATTTDKSYNGFLTADPLTSAFNKVNSSFSLSKVSSGDYQATLQSALEVDKFSLNKSVSNENILLDSSLMVKQRLLAYDFSFKSDNLKSSEGLLLPDFAGKLSIGLKQSWQGGLISSIYNPIKSRLIDLVSSPDILTNKFGTQDIENRRTNSGQTIFNYEMSNDPPVVTQNITTVDPQSIDVFKLYNGDPATVAAAKSYLHIGGTNTGSNSTTGKPNFNDQLNSAILSANTSPSFATNIVNTAPLSSRIIDPSGPFGKGRLLQFLTSYQIYNYEKVLLSQNVLNQPLTVKFNLKCDLLVYWQNQTIRCRGLLIYQWFSQSNTQTVFEYSKTISSTWSLSLHLGGSWGFDVYIPFPPPYSFAGIRFIFSIGYSIDIVVVSSHTLALPYKVIISSTVDTSIFTDSSASVGILQLVEGGIFIRGTIAKVRTDPKLTISYYWLVQKRINIQILWHYQILPYTFYWGFQARIKKLKWVGNKLKLVWGDWHTIAQWDVNIAYYGPYLILDRNWDVCC